MAALSPVGGPGEALPLPTKVVTLEAGSVNVKLPLVTGTAVCSVRSKLAEVIQGVTEVVETPLRENDCDIVFEFSLIATISNAPVLWFINAVTYTLVCGVGVAAIRTCPGRTNLEKLPIA